MIALERYTHFASLCRRFLFKLSENEDGIIHERASEDRLGLPLEPLTKIHVKLAFVECVTIFQLLPDRVLTFRDLICRLVCEEVGISTAFLINFILKWSEPFQLLNEDEDIMFADEALVSLI